MIEHEHRCFRESAGLDALETVSALTQGLDAELLEADLLIFGGSGTHGVNDDDPWLRPAMDFLVQVAEAGTPAWASCFGFQGLAVALGAQVIRDDSRKRIGAHPVLLTEAGKKDSLFTGFPERFCAQFGHHDHVVAAPEGVTVLATGEIGDCLAFRANDSNFWAAQFHAELDKRTTLDRWSYYRDLYAGEDGAEIDRHVAEAPDTPQVKKLLEGLVSLALERREAK
jgi:GMP synthase (glutamine-hydrolysing)